ncbi:MAG TPA: Hpt domain-containing protein [Desulfovibrio sp.]|jgi:two-component system chemotaxis sensor kinase CheA|uniref:Hpt domain-containing protein n=1 Tax=Desulfovibrio TaxID=872 RepID=UPI00040A4032|nr:MULTISPECIES: Hpt domain-containing protein [Desulfovibrio]MDY0306899.1 Hpt domain-containing protein [Desulfovibrionaceae bacterium]HMM37248.1 Hpt domain-containing protein [Desulfovibrio sp.]
MTTYGDDVLTVFVEESRERLASIERGLLVLEKNCRDADEAMIHGIFREAHSIKAGANLLHLRNIEELAHKLENILERMRRRELTPTGRIISILLEGLDAMREMVEDVEAGEVRDVSALLERLGRVAGLRAGVQRT